MAETKQGLEIALYLIHRMALNHQSETLTLGTADGDNANGVATQSTAALSPYPVNWYDAIVDKYPAGQTVPVFMQHMGNDVDLIDGYDQFVHDSVTHKIHLSNYSAADTYKISFRDSTGGVWSLIEYKRGFNETQSENVRPIHDWNGSVTHYKHGIFNSASDFNMILEDLFDENNMLLLGENYGVVVDELKAVADFSVHDATPADCDIYVANLDRDCEDDGWSKAKYSVSGTALTKVASIVAIDAAGEYFIDKADNKLYVGFVNGGPALDIKVCYRTDRSSASQEMMCRLDYMAEDGSTVEFIMLYPKSQASEISTSAQDVDDVTISCKLVSCGRPVSI
jgi:hypothetical protein